MDKNASKRFIIDSFCYGILNHLLTLEDFQSKNIDKNKITKISEKEKGLDTIRQMTEDFIVFIIRPDKNIFNIVLEIHLMLRAFRPKGLTENIIFIPRENYDIIEYMTTNNMISDFNIENLNIDLIPIDIDLLSLEREDSLKEIYIDKNLSCISDLANAVVKLETCFGKIKNKYIKGDLAQTFCDTMNEKEKENNLREGEDEILGMIVLDRSVDFITLMTTNYTCEGLIDEHIGINLGRIVVKESMIRENAKTNKNQKMKEKENNSLVQFGLTTDINKYYCYYRCMHYKDGIKYINAIKDYYKKLFSNKNSSMPANELKKLTQEIDYYMKNLKKYSLENENLINFVISPLIEDREYLKYIEKEQILLSGKLPPNLHSFYDEILSEQKDLISLIRLMIIESLTQNGIQGYQKLKREILNIYGYQKIFLFRDLEILGWLKENQILKNLKNIIDYTYAQILDKLQLIKEDEDEDEDKPKKKKFEVEDCSYVLEGFCPISLKIIEKAVRGEWNTILDTLKKMPGATSCPDDEKVIKEPVKERNIMFIIFVGGVTYTEIEAIRFLNRKFNEENLKGKRKKTQFIILTTCILNSKKILRNLGKEINSMLNMKMFFEQITKK